MFSLRPRALTFARTRRFLMEHLKNLTRPLTTLPAAPGTLVVALSSSQWSCSQWCFCSLQMSQLSAESVRWLNTGFDYLPGDVLGRVCLRQHVTARGSLCLPDGQSVSQLTRWSVYLLADQLRRNLLHVRYCLTPRYPMQLSTKTRNVVSYFKGTRLRRRQETCPGILTPWDIIWRPTNIYLKDNC